MTIYFLLYKVLTQIQVIQWKATCIVTVTISNKLTQSG